MKENLMIDYKNVLNSTKFKVISFIIFSIPIIGFLLSCKFYYGLPENFIRSSLEENFLFGMVCRHLKLWFILLLPILSMILCSDIYIEQYKNGVYKYILTKTSKTNYIISKIIVVFTITFSVVFVSLLISQVLFCITFPINGLDNARALPSFDIGYLNYSETNFLDLLRLKNRFLYNIAFYGIFALISALYSIISLSISFFIKKSKISIVFSFIIFLGIYIAFMTLGLQEYHLNYYLDGYNKGNIFFYEWLLFLVSISFILSILKLKFNDEI